jgi:hypothetical protein
MIRNRPYIFGNDLRKLKLIPGYSKKYPYAIAVLGFNYVYLINYQNFEIISKLMTTSNSKMYVFPAL